MNPNKFENKIKEIANNGRIEPSNELWERLELKRSHQPSNNKKRSKWFRPLIGIAAVSFLFVFFALGLTQKKGDFKSIAAHSDYLTTELVSFEIQNNYSQQDVHKIYNAYNEHDRKPKSKKLSSQLKVKRTK